MLLASCGPGPLRVSIPTPAGAESVVVIVERPGGAPAVYAASTRASGAALPAVERWDDAYEVRLTALYYARPLEAIGLSSGAIAPATASEPSRGLPDADSALEARVSPGATGAEWAAPPSVTEVATTFRVPAACPSAPHTSAGPLDLPRGCAYPGPPREQACWGPFTEMRELNDRSFADSHDAVGSAVVEGRDTWLYVTTDRRRSPSGANFTRIARVKLTGPTTLDARSFEDLGLTPPVETSPLGWHFPPRVRADGLEMFFSSSFPDAHFWDEELFVSSRTSTSARWSEPVPLTSLSSNTNGNDPAHKEDNDEVNEPVLLPDYKTLLYYANHANLLMAARRKTTDPGDTRFEELGPVSSFERGSIRWLTLSCDRGHLIYAIDADPNPGFRIEARLVKIQSLDPLAFGPPMTIRTATGSAALVPHQLTLSPVEAPDCRTIYVSQDFKVWAAPRAACR